MERTPKEITKINRVVYQITEILDSSELSSTDKVMALGEVVVKTLVNATPSAEHFIDASALFSDAILKMTERIIHEYIGKIEEPEKTNEQGKPH